MNGVFAATPGPCRDTQKSASIPFWVIILLLALSVRLIELGHQNLWCDEVLSVNVSHGSVSGLPEALAASESNKPPFYYLFMHYWLLGGASEFWVRLPSAIFGALACVVMLFLGRDIFGTKTGWMPAVVLCVLPFHVYYSQEARMYALLTLTGMAAMLFLFRFCRDRRCRDAIFYFLFASLSCYVFTYALFLIPFACLLYLFFKPRRDWKMVVSVWTINFLVGISFIPWMLRLIHSVQTGHGLHALMRAPAFQTGGYSLFALGLGTTFGPSTEQLRIFGKHIFTEAPGLGALFVVGLLIELAVLLIGLGKLWRSNRNAFFFALLGLAVFLGIPFFANVLKPGIPNNPRYAILAVIPLVIILTGFVEWAMEAGACRKVLLAVLTLCFADSLVNNYFNPQYAREDIRSAARYVEGLKSPPSHLLICADFMKVPWDYYYHGSTTIMPFSVGQQLDDPAFKPFMGASNSLESFGLIYARPDYGDPRGLLPGWLEQHFHLDSHEKWTGVDVYIFNWQNRQGP